MKILVVDDELDIQDLFKQKFRREIKNGEIDISFAFSGEQALEYMNSHSSESILILSDINMPGMTGIELLRKIREKNPIPPPKVMIITAYGDDSNRNQALQFGANDFLTKPIDFNELKAKLFK